MRVLRSLAEAEMIASFLRAEIDADRYAAGVQYYLAQRGLPEAIVRAPDVASAADNQARADILGDFRGWRRDAYLFQGFPGDVSWWLGDLDSDEVQQVLSANHPTWVSLSGGTRRFRDIATGAALDATDVGPRSERIAARYRAGEHLEPPILVLADDSPELIAIEGHTRLTAWLKAGRTDSLEVILGRCSSLTGWGFR